MGAAVARLSNLHDGEEAIPDVVRWGDLAVPALETLLRGPSQSVPHSRCWAANALSAIGSAAANDALLRALQDVSGRTLPAQLEEAETVVLGRIAEHLSAVPGEPVSVALLDTLRIHRSSPSCVRAVGSRREMRSVLLLADCLFEDSSRNAAVAALAGFGADAVPYLCRAALPPAAGEQMEPPTHIEGRRAAVSALGHWLSDAPGDRDSRTTGVREALVAALYDPQRSVRVGAAIALSRVPGDSASVITHILVSALAETPWQQLESVMDAIESLGLRAEAPLCAVIGARPGAGSDGERRIRAVTLAGRIGAVGAVPVLASLSSASDERLRLEAIRALARMPSEETGVLLPYLRDSSDSVRRTAFSGLHRRQALSLARIVESLSDRDARIRRLARVLLHRRGREALPILIHAVRSAGDGARGLVSRLRLCREALALIIAIKIRSQRCL